MTATLQATPGGLALQFPYDPALVAALKQTVPPSARRWDGARKVWMIEPTYGQSVATLVYQMTGQRVAVPATASLLSTTPDVRLLMVEYVGRCKDTGYVNVEPRASGFADGDWSVTFTESVLRDWFEGGLGDPTAAVPRRANNFYTALGVPDDADDAAIKAGYRRMAMHTHPDRNHEEGAAERFRAVQLAYDVLSDPVKRRKYNAGLALEASLPHGDKRSGPTRHNDEQYGYRSPLRCGWILAEGQPTLGRFSVSKILAWTDITNEQGQVLVTSWPAGATMFEKAWYRQ